MGHAQDGVKRKANTPVINVRFPQIILMRSNVILFLKAL